jgi:uncharacterized membrane protein YjgN (DUF898 family)
MHRPHKSKTKSWLYSYALSWIELVQGLIGVITFGIVTPEWDTKFVFWDAKREMEAINANYDKPRNGKAGRTK